MQREIRSWCEARVAGWRRELEEAPCERERPAERPRVHIFVDDANIFGRTSQSLFSIAQLAACVERGRDVEERVVIGSGTSERARGLWEQQGYRVDTDPRPGRQRFVDEALHARLMQTATKSFGPPRTIALVTGDGNRNEGRTSFPACIEIALKHGWPVELHTWRASCSASR